MSKKTVKTTVEVAFSEIKYAIHQTFPEFGIPNHAELRASNAQIPKMCFEWTECTHGFSEANFNFKGVVWMNHRHY